MTLSVDEIQEEWHQPSKKSTPSSSQTFSEADGVTPPTERSEVESKPSNSHLLDDEHSILQPNYCSQFSIHMASEELEVSGWCFIILVSFIAYLIKTILINNNEIIKSITVVMYMTWPDLYLHGKLHLITSVIVFCIYWTL